MVQANVDKFEKYLINTIKSYTQYLDSISEGISPDEKDIKIFTNARRDYEDVHKQFKLIIKGEV